MVFDSKTNFNTLFSDGTKYDGFAVALKAKNQLIAASFRNETGVYKGLVNSIATQMNTVLEKELISSMGGKIIKTRSGGFVPDYYVEVNGVPEFRELKLSSIKEEEGVLSRKKEISLAGGEGLIIRPGTATFVGDITVENDNVKFSEIEVQNTRFYNRLVAAKNNQKQIVSLLNGNSRAAKALRTTLISKANTIQIPYTINGKSYLSSIKFDWLDITQAAFRRIGKFEVIEKEDNKKQSYVTLNFYFFGSTITKALNNSRRELIKINETRLLESMREIINNTLNKYGPSASTDLAQILRELGFEFAVRYLKGSVIISKGGFRIKYNKPSKDKQQKFISSVQWTDLTQKRLGETMEKLGPPNAPYLKERSKRFRQSVQVSPDYRRNTLRYMYMPLYSSLTAYGYDPDRQVATAIREVAQSLYTRKFNITRM